MKKRKVPMRSCVVTKERLPKMELVRIVKNKEGDIFVDETSKANGRGVYLKKDALVFQKAKKTKILNRFFEAELSDSIYDDLDKLIKQ